MGRNLEFDSRVLELNSRFLPKASLPLCLGYSLPKKEKKFLMTALSIVARRDVKGTLLLSCSKVAKFSFTSHNPSKRGELRLQSVHRERLLASLFSVF